MDKLGDDPAAGAVLLGGTRPTVRAGSFSRATIGGAAHVLRQRQQAGSVLVSSSAKVGAPERPPRGMAR